MMSLFYPYIPKNKILKELSDTLSGKWIGQGPKVDLFEKKFGQKMGYIRRINSSHVILEKNYKYPLMVNSGTSALELAYHLLGLKEGDIVVVPVLDFIGGHVGLLRRGCELLFCDIERDTLNIDPDALVRLLKTKEVRAVIGVHLGGIHFNKKIYSMCKKYNVPLIVDSAHYLAPTHGDYICYSFQAIKHITTGDGGMLVLKNKREYERAKKLRWFGIGKELKKHSKTWEQRAATSDIEELGYKFQPTDIDACFGLSALQDIDKVIAYRKNLAMEYRKGLRSVGQIQVVADDTYWLLTVLAKKRNALADYLGKYGIESNLVHIRSDVFKIFGGKRRNLPNMNWVEPRYLCLPLNTKINKSDVKFICSKIKDFYGE